MVQKLLERPLDRPSHNNQYNREANCIEQADESAALPIFVFMVAQVRAYSAFLKVFLLQITLSGYNTP